MRKFGLLALIAPTVIAASIAAAPAFALQGGSSAYPTASSALSAEITSKLDTKNATVGEAVTAKTLVIDDAGEWYCHPERRDAQRKSDRGAIEVVGRYRLRDHLL